MKILYLLLFIPLFAQCQEFKTKPYDNDDEKLRSVYPASKLTKIILNENWGQRDSLSYLRFKNLEQIYIDTDSIPNWTIKFPKLKLINSLSNHKVKSIPKNIGDLEKLEVIDITRGSIKVIPNSISKLKNLEGLILDNNQINKIPKEIGNLKNLVRLSLEDNTITELPEEICKLKKLKTLYISDNMISTLPSCIGELQELEALSINNNPIYQLPKSIFTLPKLTDIYIDDTPLQENELIQNKLKDLTEENMKKKVEAHNKSVGK